MFTWLKNILSFLRSRILIEFVLFSSFAAGAWAILTRFMDAAQAFFLYNFVEKGLLAAWKKHMENIDKEKNKKELEAALINKEKSIYFTFYMKWLDRIIDTYSSDDEACDILLEELIRSINSNFTHLCVSQYVEIQHLHTSLNKLDIESDDFLDDIKTIKDDLKKVITTDAFKCKTEEKL